MNLRTCCKFCFAKNQLVQATHIAPQHSGGDETLPATWVPVCDKHFEHWYDDIDISEQLPSFGYPQSI